MTLSRRQLLRLPATVTLSAFGAESDNWPAFRGRDGDGVAEGYPILSSWNADSAAGKLSGVKWKSPVPGLGHSSPIIVGNRIYVCSAVRKAAGKAPLKLAVGGEPTGAEDNDEQSWVVFCYDAQSGKVVWRQSARSAKPRATRHEKATHANTTLATDGKRLVAFFRIGRSLLLRP